MSRQSVQSVFHGSALQPKNVFVTPTAEPVRALSFVGGAWHAISAARHLAAEDGIAPRVGALGSCQGAWLIHRSPNREDTRGHDQEKAFDQQAE